MTVKTLSSKQFNQDSSGAIKAANDGAVFITDRGKPSHVLMSIADYEKLICEGANVIDMLAMRTGGEIDLELQQLGRLSKPLDLD